MIPLVDLNAQYLNIKDEIDHAIKKCIDQGNFIKGKIVTDFENEFASFIGSKYCLGCGNGTDALEIILTSLGIGPGDEVIVPALSWISSSECVNNVGAEPVFVDINPVNYTIDVNKIEDKITSKTKAVLPVHLYGSPADMDVIMHIAERHHLYVIEDCAQAHGAEYYGQKAGTFGIASAFSFFPSKNLGAFGDGGAILTNDKNLAEKAMMISNHGQLHTKHSHRIIGRNSRLDTLQAAVLSVKLRYLGEWNQSRIRAALKYKSGLEKKKEILLPITEPGKKHVYHLFVIRCNERKKLIELLDNNNISSGIHYPTPLPFLEVYNYKRPNLEDFPVALMAASEIISLPIYPEISENQIDFICNLIIEKF
jgi:dTDP-4-amino-4,6-dideoxygalactose transaminase